MTTIPLVQQRGRQRMSCYLTPLTVFTVLLLLLLCHGLHSAASWTTTTTLQQCRFRNRPSLSPPRSFVVAVAFEPLSATKKDDDESISSSSSSTRDDCNVDDDQSSSSMGIVGDDLDCVAMVEQSKSLYESLKARQDTLEQGIGHRYVCRTQQGFLNVHSEPGDPFDTSNIVNVLTEGQMVTSVGPPHNEVWIHHDAGGWSISHYQGFTWLQRINDE